MRTWLVAQCLSAQILACPAYVENPIGFRTLGGARSDLRIFSKNPETSVWRSVPFDVLPMNAARHFLFPRSDVPVPPELSAYDRIVIDPELFGAPRAGKEKLPCGNARVLQVSDPLRDRFAYITRCTGEVMRAKLSPAVNYDASDNRLESSVYKYFFHPRNHMLFRSILLKTPKGDVPIARNSQMNIRADIRNFFTMNFRPNDVESYLEDYYTGQNGVYGRLSFYLKVLFFKIKISLLTDASFFADSAHVPLVLFMPYAGETHLHPGSHMLYSWEMPENVARTFVAPDLILAPDKSSLDKNAAPQVQPQCVQGTCRFSASAQSSTQKLTFEFRMPKNLVDQGFFPRVTANAPHYLEDMDWGAEAHAEGPAVYFETSHVPKGEHEFDFWMQFSAPAAQRSECPQRVLTSLLP